MTETAIEAAALGRSFGRRRRPALDGCAFRLPAGSVCALVGPNGAGKSTLLALAAGLLPVGEGALTVLGGTPAAARERVGYVAQDKPLHPHLTVGETLRFGRELNPRRWDARAAERVVDEGALDRGTKIRALSGGRRTLVALALALGKRPELLLLDEPMADLDPLARHRLTATLMADAAEHGTTVVMSSHVVAELDGCCDHLLLLGAGRVRLAGPLDDLLAAHRLVTGRADASLAPHTVVESRTTGRQLTALVRPEGPLGEDVQSAAPTLEELVLAHLRAPHAAALRLGGTREVAV
ncbi:ABC transporter ATP-binding protein [Streptomyces zinciresistens K42]|uniref:ABC transporter ATP-binding protein n=1 Tax=Streptomyces zinciresistens K42 TaxID=700597 RepID=G2GAL6_9ACTN|nr:ABC transporter ATP-binding protein [Streptomyces zinciresistens]EGX59463.1 ABC transporter ATP-binding protein [Streptomyces zinciresistens K42]